MIHQHICTDRPLPPPPPLGRHVPPFKDPDIPCSTSISYTIGEIHAETEWLWLIVVLSADYRLLFNVSVTEKTQHGQDISADL